MKRVIENIINFGVRKDFSPIIGLVAEILKLGMEIESVLMILTSTKSKESIDIVCFTSREIHKFNIITVHNSPLDVCSIFTRIKIMSGMKISVSGVSQIGKFELNLRKIGKPLLATVTTIPIAGGEAISISFNCLPTD